MASSIGACVILLTGAAIGAVELLKSKSAVPRLCFRDTCGQCEALTTFKDGFTDAKPPFCIESFLAGGPDCSSVAKTASGTILAVWADGWPPLRWSPIFSAAYTTPEQMQRQQHKEAPLTRTMVTVAAPEVDSSGLISQVGRSHCPSVQVATPDAV